MTIKKANYSLFRICRLRKFLSLKASKKLMESFVLYPLLYGSSIWAFSITKSNLRRLQLIQNRALKNVLREPKFTRVTPLLKRMRWLRIHQLILIRHLCLSRSAIAGEVGQDLKQHFLLRKHEHRTRSKKKQPFYIKAHSEIESKGFAITAPRLVNQVFPLPNKSGRNFRNDLIEKFAAENLFPRNLSKMREN